MRYENHYRGPYSFILTNHKNYQLDGFIWNNSPGVRAIASLWNSNDEDTMWNKNTNAD